LTNLFAYIQTVTVFSEKSWDILRAALTTLEIKKGSYLLKAEEVCNAIFFISKGYCRTFYNKDGEDINTTFYFENDFATNIKSLTKNLRSEYSIQACEHLTVVKFDKEKLLEAYKQSQEIETLGRKLLELIVARQEEHSDLFKLLTAQQRYEYLQKNQPEILQRVSLTQLSSYLGVARETISRIRNKRKQK
jgi:CRP-like cAMP-binding protein